MKLQREHANATQIKARALSSANHYTTLPIFWKTAKVGSVTEGQSIRVISREGKGQKPTQDRSRKVWNMR